MTKQQAQSQPGPTVRVLAPGVTGEDLMRQAGRKPASKPARSIRCSSCGKPGHNALTCKTRPRAAAPKPAPAAPPARDPLRSPARQVAARINGNRGGRPPGAGSQRQLDGGVRLSVTVALSAEDLGRMDSDSLQQLFAGLTQILSARDSLS